MSEIVGLLRKTLASSCNYSERYFDEFSQCAREFYASRQGSPAHQAVFSAFRSTRGSDVQTVVRAVGEAIVTALNGRQLRIPFFAAWENTWRFEGGQLLRRWVMADRPGDSNTVALRTAILAEDLFLSLLEAQRWWIEDAAKLGVCADELSEVSAGLGDFHCGHHSVMVLRANDGRRWALRPTSGGLESFIAEIIARCGPENVRTPVPALCAHDHSWFHFVPHTVRAEPATRSSMRDAGALLTCGWALRGNDFHRGNSVMSPNGLTLIDAETFLQPLSSRWKSVNERRWAESVLGVGVLPRRLGAGGPESIEVGLVLQRSHNGDRTPFPRPIISADTDGSIHTSWDYTAPVIEDGLYLPEDQNRLTELTVAFADGAEECQRVFAHNRDRLLSLLEAPADPLHPRMSRVILTPTFRYSQILRLLSHPLIISDEEATIVAAASVCTTGDSRLWPAEAFQMLNGDVPAFACTYGGTALTTLRGEPIPEKLGGAIAYAELSPQDATIARVRDELSSPAKWQQQKLWINVAFRARGAQLPLGVNALLPNKYVEQRHAIERILASIGANPERVFGFDSLSALVGEDFDRAWEPGAGGDELYGGMAGILSSLLIIDEPAFEMYEQCRQAADQWARDTWIGDEDSRLGLWDGAGGVFSTIFLLHRGRTITDGVYHALQRYCEEVIRRLGEFPQLVSADNRKPGHYSSSEEFHAEFKRAEVIGGAAGRVRLWIELIGFGDKRIAAIALEAIDHELEFLRSVLYRIGSTENLEGGLRGYAHGLAGILDAYLGATRILNRDLDKDSEMIYRHLQSILRWLKDLQKVPLGWCHGLAGYALVLSEFAMHEEFREDALQGLHTVIHSLEVGSPRKCHVGQTLITHEVRQEASGIGPSACHGAAGIVEALDVAANHYEISGIREKYCDEVLRPALSEESVLKESGAVALMCGVAGVVAPLVAESRPCGVVSAPWHRT